MPRLWPLFLCIDDDPRILELQQAVLGNKGYTVLTAIDGETGIALTRRYPINAVVLDFNMPGLDGSQVAEVLMKDYPKLPVVICSGCLDDIPEGLKWFADALLEKADGPEALISAIERLVPAGSVINKIIPRITVRTAERLSA